MGIVGGRRGPARPRAVAVIAMITVLLGATLAGCAEEVDEARTVQTHRGRLHQVVDVDVATPDTDHAPAITVTYADSVDGPVVLAALIAEVRKVAGGLDYPDYLLTLVPAVE